MSVACALVQPGLRIGLLHATAAGTASLRTPWFLVRPRPLRLTSYAQKLNGHSIRPTVGFGSRCLHSSKATRSSEDKEKKAESNPQDDTKQLTLKVRAPSLY